MERADSDLAPLLTPDVIGSAVDQVPTEWLAGEPGFDDVAALRTAYTAQLLARLAARDTWLPPLAADAAAGLTTVVLADRAGRRRARPSWLAGPDPGRGPTGGRA